jgi:HEAT repeat protein
MGLFDTIFGPPDVGKLMKKGDFKGLAKVLRQGDTPEIRIQAAEALGKIGNSTMLPPLIEALADPSDQVRCRASAALGRIGDDRATAPLLDLATEEKSIEIKQAAFDSLIRLGWKPGLDKASYQFWIVNGEWERAAITDGTEAAKLLLRISSDESRQSTERHKAALALSHITSETAVPTLIDALNHPQIEVADNAAKSLGMIGNLAAVPALVEALQRVPRSAAEALVRCGSKSAYDPLVALLSSDAPLKVRLNAGKLLKRFGCKPCSGSRDQEVIQRIIEGEWDDCVALGLDAVDGLIAALDDADQTTRAGAAYCLGEIGEKKALKPLENCLTDRERLVGFNAAVSLGKIKDPSSVDALLLVFARRDPFFEKSVLSKEERQRTQLWSTLAGAAKALSEIGDPRGIEPVLVLVQDIAKGLWGLKPGTSAQYRAYAYAYRALIKMRSDLGPAVAAAVIAARYPDNGRPKQLKLLGDMRELSAVHILVAQLKGNFNPDFSYPTEDAVVYALARIGQLVEEEIDKAIQSAGPRELTKANRLREEILGSRRRYERIQELNLLDLSPQQRLQEVEDLGKCAIEMWPVFRSEILNALTPAFSDSDPGIREKAASSLLYLDDACAIPPLMDMLKDDNVKVRLSAIRSLAKIGDHRAAGALSELMDQEKGGEIWREAANALGAIERNGLF